MVNKIDSFFEKFEKFFDATMHLVESLLDAFFHAYEICIDLIRKSIVKILDNYILFTKSIYSLFRWSTIPFNFLIVRTWLWYIYGYEESNPLDKKGIHYVRALPRKGKSLLAFNKANRDMESTGFSSYFTSPIEKPKITKDGKFYYLNHKVIDLKSYYKDGVKRKRFNTQFFKRLWVDEFHVLNNPRRNNEKENKDFIIPLVNDFVRLTHLGFECIYLLSQVPSNDIQIMSILAGYHDVEVKKGVDYLRWLLTGKFEVLPLYIKVKSHEIVWDSNGSWKKVLKRTWKERINQDNLPYFETLAERHVDDHLPFDYNPGGKTQ